MAKKCRPSSVKGPDREDMPLSKRQAIEFAGLEKKIFENYFQVADEFRCIKRKAKGGRYFFVRSSLAEWKADYRWRCVELTIDDYSLCLDFALAKHFAGYVPSDWSTGRQREFGQKVTNWIKGQLGEVAVKKFLEREFGAIVELDFEIREGIVAQDIILVTKDGKSRVPKVGVGIKSSKPKSAYLVLDKKETAPEKRRSDYYIFCRPDIPDDHLIRLTKERIIEVIQGQQHYSKYKDQMKDFGNITCEVAGWCSLSELERVTSIPGQTFDGVRFVKKSGLLHRDRKSWEELISKL
jgi:hypothetical protein